MRGNKKADGIKKKKNAGCDLEAAFLEKNKKRQKDREREIQIRAFIQAISGPAVGFRAHLCDELAAFFLYKVAFMTGGMYQNISLPFRELTNRAAAT